jgi:hypothetical protein
MRRPLPTWALAVAVSTLACDGSTQDHLIETARVWLATSGRLSLRDDPAVGQGQAAALHVLQTGEGAAEALAALPGEGCRARGLRAAGEAGSFTTSIRFERTDADGRSWTFDEVRRRWTDAAGGIGLEVRMTSPGIDGAPVSHVLEQRRVGSRTFAAFDGRFIEATGDAAVEARLREDPRTHLDGLLVDVGWSDPGAVSGGEGSGALRDLPNGEGICALPGDRGADGPRAPRAPGRFEQGGMRLAVGLRSGRIERVTGTGTRLVATFSEVEQPGSTPVEVPGELHDISRQPGLGAALGLVRTGLREGWLTPTAQSPMPEGSGDVARSR